MHAEIVATGDEIRTGVLVDSNTAAIAETLESEGIEVKRHAAVGDSIDEIAALLGEIGSRADVCLVTGGLGPTVDDVTAEAAARAAGVSCELDRDALVCVERFFRERERSMPDRNVKQAMLPTGSRMLDNPVGTAPGFMMTIGRCRFFFMPGVPSEMRRMLGEQVMPVLREMMGDTPRVHRVTAMNLFGLPESVVDERLDGFDRQFPDLQIGFRASFPVIQVKVYGQASAPEPLEDRMAAAGSWIRERLGDGVFSSDNEHLASVIGRRLRQREATLAVAESCTGGLVSHLLTNVPGSSDFLLLSAVTYANSAKTDILGVDPALIETYGAVHEKTAAAMAAGVRRISGADYAVSTSGIAGPTGGTDDKPVGTVCLGLATATGSQGWRRYLPMRDREKNKMIFAFAALDILRRELTGLAQWKSI